ncbi:hypothetical protein O181_037686 [Austropuccinia psidii MF-1]|uniref:Reverse transcriptase/retrotransposon-derived protein RNase H-like domain-containing protein n=1 Tax=Austropuccinia psidii MF-1 TaxID=1389203 RepID=A0A9Q3D6P1_9BASI|nr:hypothetical protein [Austropuccinia psidii MF-1]
MNEEALRKFQQLKEDFTKDPVLSDFKPALPTILVTDSSDYALGAVLSKVSDSGKHPVAFDICNLLPEELNYEINNKEIIAIVLALKHLRSFLLYLSSSFQVITDNSSLQYLMAQNYSLSINPAGLNYYLNFISPSLTTLST